MPDEPFPKKSYREIASALLGEAGAGVGGRTALTDDAVGSVVRTLMETFARELTVAYEQLDFVYRAAYLDTAEGAALDNVVALLGIERRRAGDLVGSVEFSRLLAAEADIAIPAGTRVAGAKAPVVETVREVMLRAGDRVVRVDVRSIEADPKVAQVEHGALTLMPRPIVGIERVGNATPLLRRSQPEDDAALRDRARAAVRRSQAGTVAGLEAAVRAAGVQQVEIFEDLVGAPGEVRIVMGDLDMPPELRDQVLRAVAETRPAGVRVTANLAIPVKVRVSLVLELSRTLPPEEQEALRQKVLADLRTFVGQLRIGEPLRLARLRGVLAADPRVAGVAETDIQAFAGEERVRRTPGSGGDIPVGAEERILLDGGDGAPRIELRAPGVRVDAELPLLQDRDQARSAVERAASEALTTRLAAVATEQGRIAARREAGERVDDLVLTMKSLTEALRASLAAANLADSVNLDKLRVDVVHERDARVVVLAADGASKEDRLGPGETPRLGTVAAKPVGA
jgi:uncharacterized phage protein gp47/JayE